MNEEKLIFNGSIFTLVTKQVEINGLQVQRDIIRHPGGVGVLVCQDHKILLVKQFRHAINQETLEIPAGKLEYGEDPKVCGLRELNEETGYTCQSLVPVFSFVSTPGFCDERIWVFEAKHPEKADIRLEQDPDENIEYIWMDLHRAYGKIRKGQIEDAKTVIAIQHAMLESEN